jgi:hypothetical protein
MRNNEFSPNTRANLGGIRLFAEFGIVLPGFAGLVLTWKLPHRFDPALRWIEPEVVRVACIKIYRERFRAINDERLR